MLFYSNSLEKINLEAARIVTGATQLTSTSLLLKESGRLSLSDRRKKHQLLLFYKMYHNMTPDYLTDIVPPHNFETHSYNTRQQNNLVHISCKTKHYFDSFLPSVIRDWNEIPEEIRNSSLYRFNSYLNRNKLNIPKFLFKAVDWGKSFTHV